MKKVTSSTTRTKNSSAVKHPIRNYSISESPRSKREQIVKAATKVFLTNGYEGTSIATVAKAAGVIKATIYSHFKDKNALFKAIMESLTIKQGLDRFMVDSSKLTPAQFIDAFASKISGRNSNPQFRALIRVIVGESGRFPELAQLFYETVSARGNSMVANYIKSKPEMNIPDPQAAAQVITGSMVYWMLSQEIMGGKHVAPISPKRIINALKHLFLNRLIKT